MNSAGSRRHNPHHNPPPNVLGSISAVNSGQNTDTYHEVDTCIVHKHVEGQAQPVELIGKPPAVQPTQTRRFRLAPPVPCCRGVWPCDRPSWLTSLWGMACKQVLRSTPRVRTSLHADSCAAVRTIWLAGLHSQGASP